MVNSLTPTSPRHIFASIPNPQDRGTVVLSDFCSERITRSLIRPGRNTNDERFRSESKNR